MDQDESNEVLAIAEAAAQAAEAEANVDSNNQEDALLAISAQQHQQPLETRIINIDDEEGDFRPRSNVVQDEEDEDDLEDDEDGFLVTPNARNKWVKDNCQTVYYSVGRI